MSSEEFHHLKIRFEDVASITNNFDVANLIGRGGFGPVYKGKPILPERHIMMAFKRLDSKYGQGSDEFWKEIIMLSKYKHENLVSLICFCDEGDERILGYKFASRGSLDSYLCDISLTWTQRIKICIGVARALRYLHDPTETQERVLHRDIKSSNILLDENWTAKVSDFGLSKFGPASQQQSYLFSNTVGTPGYCDPLYWELGFLTKESDIYSFGVVLFEVMCAKLCCEYHNGRLNRILVNMWKNRYDENKLDDIVSPGLKGQMERDSLMKFAAIASRCLNRNRKERPTMSEIVRELEIALEMQDQRNKYLVRLGKLADPPLCYQSQEELLMLLSKGFRYKNTMWVCINKNGVVCEMISATKCVTIGGYIPTFQTKDSRFDDVVMEKLEGAPDFKIKVSTQFLVPHVTYAINLIFKVSKWDHGTCVPYVYKLDEEKHHSGPFITLLREDGWLITQLYQFTCYRRQQQFSIQCSPLYHAQQRIFGHHIFQGIEFRPVEYEPKEKKMVNMQSISNADTNWDQKLPIDYTDLINFSNETIQWITKKELYFLLRKGFLIDNGEKWFCINKNMKKCVMLPARAFLRENQWMWKPSQGSRFEMVAESPMSNNFVIKCEITSQVLSPETNYSCHLIYKVHSPVEGNIIIHVDNYLSVYSYPWYIYLIPSPTSIIGSKGDKNSHIPSPSRKIKGHPKLRKDGWMEFQLWKASSSTTGMIKVYLELRSRERKKEMNLSGLVVQGIELRAL